MSVNSYGCVMITSMATTTKRGASTKAKSTRSKSATASKKTTTKKTTKKPATKKPASKKAATTKKATTAKVTKPAKTTTKKTDIFKRLNIWNWALAGLHAVQGIVVLILAESSLFSVTTNYLTTDKLASTEGAPVLVEAQRTLFDVNLAYIVAAFFFMSAIAHLVIATVYRKRYEAGLQQGINRARWYEYGISASTMMIAIAMLAGVSDLSTLVLIFGATLVMNLLGLVMEIVNQGKAKTSWLSYIVGCIVGALPWIAVAIYLIGANMYGDGDIPTFVYYIYGSMFVFFSSFAVNMYLQYKKLGRWQDYLFGERVYMVLSLVAKSALAWQVFAGTLRP